MLGLILADVGNPFYSELAVSASDAARARGCEIILSHTADSPAAFVSAVRMMLDHGVTGLMTTVVNHETLEVARFLRHAGIPAVQISRRVDGFPGAFVGMDDYLAGREVVNHLIEHGYEKICVACGPVSSSASHMREQGMLDALRDARVPLPRAWHVNTLLSTGGGERLARHLLRSGELPQAVACGTDAMALGLMSVFRYEGVRVPQDVAVTGYDGLLISRSELLGLTSVIQPRVRMTRLAVDLLLSSEPINKVSLICPHKLSIGQSCGCPAPPPPEAV